MTFTYTVITGSFYLEETDENEDEGYDFDYEVDSGQVRDALEDKTLLSVGEEDEDNLMFKLVLNDEQLKLPHKELVYTKINDMLKTTEDQFIIIYGSSDPWYSVRPDDVTGRENISIYVNDNYPHTTNISNFDKEVSAEITTKIKTILGLE